MSERHPIAARRIVYRTDGMAAVRTQRDITYRQSPAGPLTMDLYFPHRTAGAPGAPAVLFVVGYPDVGVANPLGCRFKEVGMLVSLAQLVATGGMTAVTYTTHQPTADLDALLDHLDRQGATLGLDPTRVGLWATSGHVPRALSALMTRPRGTFKAAVLSNGYTLDLEGSAVAEAAGTYGFVDACAGRTIDELPDDVPLFIARSGRDDCPGLNEALDRFVSAAITRNTPVTFTNCPTAPHAFEIHDDSAQSRRIISQMLAFMRQHLLYLDGASPQAPRGRSAGAP